MRLILLFLLLPLFGKSQNDTTKYYKSFDYGWNYQRLKARAAMVLPSDTVTNKLGVVTIDTTLFVGNGSRWVRAGATGGGGGGADSAIFYTKYRSDTSRANIYTAINTKLNKSDTANAFLISVSQPNDSSLTFVKGTTSTNYIIRSSVAGSATDTTSLSNRINQKLSTSDSSIYYTKFRSDTSRANIYTAINSKLNLSDSTIYQTKFRSDTSRSNIYTAIDTKLNKSDTANAFLISVSQPNDSSLTFVKGTTSTNYIIRSSVAGSATRLITRVYNNTGSTIARGSVVYISGRHSSNLPTIALATGNSEENSYKTFALVESDIPTSNDGNVIQAGNIGNLNLPTSSYTDGDIVYLSPTVPGGITIVKPLAPFHICKIGSVTRAHPQFGAIEVKIENGWQMDELSDVQIPLYPNDSTLLQYSRVDSLWHAVSIPNAIGNNYVKPSDTSVFQRKSIAAYSLMANNTGSTANATAFTFREQATQTLSSGITWNGTAPSGTTNHQYRWNRIGNIVTLYVTLVYTTAGASNTQVTITLPADLPTPFSPTGLTAANDVLYSGSAIVSATTNTIITTARTCMLRRNTANNGFEVIATAPTAGQRFVSITIQYFTN